MAQVTTLLLAMTVFAVPSLGSLCVITPTLTPSFDPGPNFNLVQVYLMAGYQMYDCDQLHGYYQFFKAGLEMYDASCLDSTSTLDALTGSTQSFLQEQPESPDFDKSKLDNYMKQNSLYDTGSFTSFDGVTATIFKSNTSFTLFFAVQSQNMNTEVLLDDTGTYKAWVYMPRSLYPEFGCGPGAQIQTSSAMQLFTYEKTS